MVSSKMENKMGELLVILALLLCSSSVGIVTEVHAQGPSPDCSTEILELQPCLNFVTGLAPTPTSSCCAGLRTAVASKPVCLCEILVPGNTSPIPNLNITLASSLPAMCGVNADLSQCAGLLNGTSSSPSSSPFGSPPSGLSPQSGPLPLPGTSAASRMFPTILSCWEYGALISGAWILGQGLF